MVQNSSLTSEFSPLLSDVSEFAWAREAFGGGGGDAGSVAPDAINFWMGDGRAITSSEEEERGFGKGDD